MTVVLCCDDAQSGDRITRQLSGLCDVLTTVSFYNISDFLAMVTDDPNAIMLIAQTGALSTETAMAAREHNPGGEAHLVFGSRFCTFVFPAEGNIFRTFAD